MPKKLSRSAFVPLIVTEIIIGTIVALAAFLLFVDLSRDVLSREILTFDTTLSHTVYSLRTPELTEIMMGITLLGGNIALAFFSVTVFLYLLFKKYRREAFLFGVTFGIGVLLNLLLKQLVARARPEIEPLIQEIFYSYPSGHSMNAFVFYALMAYFCFHFSRNLNLGVIVGSFLILLILLIGFSRIYLGVHYPSDVLAGFFAGAAWFVTVLVVDRTIQAFRHYNSRKK